VDTDDHQLNRYFDYDQFGRIKPVQEGTSRLTTTNYFDSAREIQVLTDRLNYQDQQLTQTLDYDQLGRTRQSIDAAGNAIQTYFQIPANTGYSYELVSNPHPQAGSTDGWTRTKKDALGRVVEIAHFTGSSMPFPWGANSTTSGAVTNIYTVDSTNNLFCTETRDEAYLASNPTSRTSCVDGVGRLTRLTENGISSAPDPPPTTVYGYDALDNLISVSQPYSAARTFTYSSLKRLIEASNPETLGTIGTCYTATNVTLSNCYTYDDNGNLLTKTDGRNITTTFTYTDLDQVHTKTYSDGTPGVTYSYDKDRLLQVTSSASTYNYLTFDELGRALSASQVTNAQTYGFTVHYYPFIGIQDITYPGGRKITTGYDTGGRPQSLSGLLGATTTNYVTAAGYAPQGAIQTLTLNNGLTERTCFNARLQPVGIRLAPSAPQDCSVASTDLLNLTYNYGTTANNGNVQTQTITRGTQSWTQSYGYDGANRLNCANEASGTIGVACNTGSPAWFQTYGYDTLGNRWLATSSSSLPTPTAETPQATSWYGAASPRTNRISTWAYDAAGNVTGIPATGGTLTRASCATNVQAGVAMQRTFCYDAENRMTSATTATPVTSTYAYDGDGHRVQKTVGSSGTTVFVYDPFGHLVQEYGTASDSGTKYITADHLGSTRVETDATGGVSRCYDYLPFGEELGNGTGNRTSSCFGGSQYPAAPDVLSNKFTSKERDAETGLDFFGARYMSSAQGRFTSPDVPLLDQQPGDPQSWNLYSYVRNNPLIFTDRTGNDCVYVNSSNDGISSIDNQTNAKGCGKTGGYWVDGTVTNARFAYGSLILTGTTNGQNKTSASYGLGPDPGLMALQRGTQLAEPGVNLAGQGLMLFGSIVAPLPMAVAQCGAGNCSKTNVAMAMLPELSALYEGSILIQAAGRLWQERCRDTSEGGWGCAGRKGF